MVAELVELSKKNPIFRVFIQGFCKAGFSIISFFKLAQSWLRVRGIGGKKYRNLKKYKNIYSGKRCFIIATGPSLTIKDLEKIEKEYSFGMNSIVKAYSSTTFRPTYYGIQDHIVYNELQNDIMTYYKGCDNVFIADRIATHYSIDKLWNQFPLNMTYHAYDRWFNEKYYASFSDDIYKQVYSGFSITFSLIEIAVYMGFKEIYLLGADCNFDNKEKMHFAEYGVIDKAIGSAKERNLAGYHIADEYAKANNIKIVNATRGGSLEIFERLSLEEILGEK